MTSDHINGGKTTDITRYSDIAGEPQDMLMPIEGFEDKPLVSIEEAIAPLVDIVHDVERKAWVAKTKCKKTPSDGLSIDESTSIMLYTMEWEPQDKCLYGALNKILRAEDRRKLKPWFLYLKLFLTGLARLPSISRTIYRGVKQNLNHLYPEGETCIWWGFSSCTTSVRVLQNEDFLGKSGTRTMFNIECVTGKNIQNHSFHRSEDEILLLPARQFQVVSCLDSGNDLYIVQLKETEPPFPLLEPILLPNPTVLSNNSLTVELPSSPLEELINEYQLSSAIYLWARELTDHDIELVVKKAIIGKRCTQLSLWGNEITSTGALILADALRNNTTVEQLYLSNNYIADIGVNSLTEVLSNHNSTLKILDLGTNGITDVGAQYLAEMLKCNATLTVLALSGNKISDRGMQFLAHALAYYNTSLEELYMLGSIFVCNSTIDALADMLLQNQSLKKLYLNNCNLSVSETERLQEIANSKNDFSLYV
jgi:hypothetical protein